MLPKITIVTPSLNQGEYLEETILSVIGQNYPNLEYIIMDGGSTDNTLDIIHKYERYFAHWESRTDKGQADAINRGFRISTGDILAWLNSDDMYLPGTFSRISNYIRNIQELKIIIGNCRLFNQETKYVSMTNIELSHRNLDVTLVDYIFQASSFWTKAALDKVGPLNINLKYCLDWDWFIRANKLEVEFEAISDYLSIYRLHDKHKSATGGMARVSEIAQIYRSYHSDEIAHDYLKLRLDPSVRLIEKIMRRIRFPWRKWIMRSLFLNNLSSEQYDHIILM
jgi:glycosyltransferase involved in cell wall biosynthesis